MSGVAKRIVTADKIVTVQTIVTEEDRCIDYDDLLAAVRVEPDEWYETPWEHCDGYEHTKRRIGYYDHDGVFESVNVARCGRYDTYLLEFDHRAEKDFDDLYRYYRSNGASKGVAAEMVALSRRERMESLVNWYENGWEWWYVSAEYNGYEAMGCGGIDDYHYADTEVRAECADELADALEEDGFIIIGKPDRMSEYRKNRVANMNRKTRMFDWR